MDQQQRYGDGGDVVGAADLQDVSQAHDGGIPCRDVPRTHVIVHAQVEDDVDLRQVRVPRDVKLPLRENNFKKKHSRLSARQRHALHHQLPLPGEMLDGFRSTALLLSSPPFLEISAKIKKKVAKNTKN